MVRFIDIAVNLIGSKLTNDLDTVIAEALHSGVEKQIVIGSHLAESADAIACCQQYPQHLYCTAGVHPHYASQWKNSSQTQLINLLQQPNVVAVGECGLDYNRNFSTKSEQLNAFEAQLEIAASTQMPIYMHCRDAHRDFIRLVEQYRPALSTAVLHCFTGNLDELTECLALDLYIGITGWICDERRGQDLAEVVKYIPDNRLLLETDSPYLLPRDLRPKPKSGTNYPKYLPHIAQTVASLRKQPLEWLAKQCLQNTHKCFNLTESTS